MRALDLQKKLKKPIIQPPKLVSKKEKLVEKIDYKQIYQILLLIAVIITFLVFFYIFPMPKPKSITTGKTETTTEKNATVVIRNQITIYINSTDKTILDQVNNQLTTNSLKANLVYRKDITKSMIYCAKDQAQDAVKISAALNVDFEIKESATTDTTGIVVYYKK